MHSAPITSLVVESDLRRSQQIIGLLAGATTRRFSCTLVSTLSDASDVIANEAVELIVARRFLPEDSSGETLLRLREMCPDAVIVGMLEDAENEALLDPKPSMADECVFYKEIEKGHFAETVALAVERAQLLSDLRTRQSGNYERKGTYRALLNRIDEALFLVTRPEGKLVFANDIAKAWFPADLENVLNELFEYGVLETEEVELEIATGNPLIPNAELRSIEIEWRKQPCCMITLRNISKRKRAEEAYRASQRRLELALKSSDVGLWSWDLRNNQLQFSERWKEQLGYKAEEFENSLTMFRESLHEDDRSRVMDTLQSAFKSEVSELELEYRMRCKDGSYRKFLCRVGVFPDAAGKLASLVATHLDISEKRVEDPSENEDQQDPIARRLSERLAKRLENAVRELEQQAGWIRSHFRSDSEIRSSIQEMERLSHRVARINDILRQHDDADEQELEPIDLGNWLDGVKEQLRCFVPGKVIFETDTQELVALSGFSQSALLLAYSEGLLAISDHISSEFRSRLLVRVCEEKIFSEGVSKPCLEFLYAGTELASDQLEGIAQLGGLSVWSYESDGLASLKLVFDSEHCAVAKSKRKQLALLAEDEGVLRLAIKAMLESLDYEVIVAEDGAAAVDCFFKKKSAFDIALVDLNMPEIDGDGVYASIRACRSDLPVIKMSGDEDAWSKAGEGDDSNSRVLSKPFGVASLRQAISELSENSNTGVAD